MVFTSNHKSGLKPKYILIFNEFWSIHIFGNHFRSEIRFFVYLCSVEKPKHIAAVMIIY
jgi:hypothetical protein